MEEDINEYHLKFISPCPFCGNTVKDIPGVEHGGCNTKNSQYFIQCVNCYVRMEQDRRDKVIGMWNTRNFNQ